MVFTVQTLLSLRPDPFVSTATVNKQHRRGKREEGEVPASKHHIRPGHGRWTGRRGSGHAESTPRGQNLRRERDSKRENRTLPISVLKKIAEKRKIRARKNRRRGRPERRAARHKAISDRERARRGEITVATHNVRTMAVDGKHGVGRAAEVLSEYRGAGLDIIGLHETRRDGQTTFRQAGYVVYCSGACGNEGDGKKGQGGAGLAVKEKLTRAVARPPEFINERLLKVTLKLRGRASAVTFIAAYGPTESTRDDTKKRSFWTALDRTVKEVPKHEQLFVLMNANARTGRRGGGGSGVNIVKCSVTTVEARAMITVSVY